jgi:hypothetical protein
VLEVCAADYTTGKLSELEESLEELKEAEDGTPNRKSKSRQDGLRRTITRGGYSEMERICGKAVIRDKTRALLSGQASCERKWRDSLLALPVF